MPVKAPIYIIAGPQSSGKTTVWHLFKELKPDWHFIEELNPYAMQGRGHRGGAFVTKDLELEMTKKDMEQTAALPSSGTHVVETGIFHLVYLARHCGAGTAREFLPRYLEAYAKLKPVILFIDANPSETWARRSSIYEKRLDDAGITDLHERKKGLMRYREFMESMYPLWLEYYCLIPFKKHRIENSHGNYVRFIKKVKRLMERI